MAASTCFNLRMSSARSVSGGAFVMSFGGVTGLSRLVPPAACDGECHEFAAAGACMAACAYDFLIPHFQRLFAEL